jgi:hypothetical protein
MAGLRAATLTGDVPSTEQERRTHGSNPSPHRDCSGERACPAFNSVPNARTEPGSSGGIVSDYGLDDRGSIPGGDKGFFL